MKRKIFFFDVDGTLVNDDHAVPLKNCIAIRELKKQGHYICLATGRNLHSCESVIDEVGVDFDFFITNNGQEVLDHKRDIMFTGKLDHKKILEINDFVQEQGGILLPRNKDFSGALCTKEKYYEIAEQVVRDVWVRYGPKRKFLTKADLINHQIPLVVSLTPPEGVKAIMDKYSEEFEVFNFDPNACDIYKKGISKLTGIKVVLEHLNEDLETYAFGDSWNDIAMLQFCDKALVMGNATSSEVRNLATKIIKNNNEAGIYWYLKEEEIIYGS